MKRAPYLLLLLLILVFPVSAQSITVSQEEKIESLAIKYLNASKVPGMAISISYKGKLIYSRGFGYADIEQQVEVNPSKTKFRIASISKTLTADALIQLVKIGKIDLDLPVQTYVPTFPIKPWPITTRQAAGHLAGIRHYKGNEFLSSKHYPNVSQGLDIFKDDDLLNEPGTRFRYSSYGYNLVSAIIEGAADMDYLTYMQLNVFDKLGMSNTTPDVNSEIIANRGRYYMKTGETINNAVYVDNSYKWAGGGFLSTSEDLILFALAHQSPGYLDKASLELLVKSQKTTSGNKTNYGLGWSTTTDKEGYHWVGHSGGAMGGTSKLVVYPKEEIIIVVLTNMSEAHLGDFPHQLGWEFMD